MVIPFKPCNSTTFYNPIKQLLPNYFSQYPFLAALFHPLFLSYYDLKDLTKSPVHLVINSSKAFTVTVSFNSSALVCLL